MAADVSWLSQGMLILLTGTAVLALKLEMSPIQKFQEIDLKAHN